MRKLNKIILHCSDSDQRSHDDINIIKEWHLARNFSDVGYHYFIRKDGLIQIGRDVSVVGAHCKGQNSKSIGICLSGRNKFTEVQFSSLKTLISALDIRFESKLTVHAHNEFSKKSCPNFDISDYRI